MQLNKIIASILLGFLILCSFGIAFAAVTNTTNFTSLGTITIGNGDYGLKFTANNTTYVTEVNISVAGATQVRIVDSGLATLGTASFSGTNAVFSGSGIAITAGQTYYVLINNGASSFTTDYGDAPSDLPANNTDINFVLADPSNNAVFQAPYNATISGLTTGGGNQLGITSVITNNPVTPFVFWQFFDF